ncbi:DUF5691 domain-containing protein [Streptomyces sp. NPDC060184]|uniref:DUF5691 domain-containing protein n=1 Tax=Streptomyces sp. NPDC060184 TaxID=3347064 RepID=UPI0036664B8E
MTTTNQPQTGPCRPDRDHPHVPDRPHVPDPADATPRPTEWDELVTRALLGTDRRPAHSPDGGFGGPAALLDAAAVHAVRRRAGLRPATAVALPGRAPDDPRPPLPPAARRRLAQLLADRAGGPHGGRRGTAPDLTELIPQWLAAANRHGYRAPAALLPALLDAARARTDLRPHALAFAGPRGRWLAALNTDWRFALRDSAPQAALRGGPGGCADAEAIRELWEEGLFTERIALLSAVRLRDPDAARDLLAGTWSGERAEDRLMFLDTLRAKLSGADEDFLEEALGDRSRNVRATAAELLSTLPDTALGRRMAARAASCVSLDRRSSSAPPPVPCGSSTASGGPAPTSGAPARAVGGPSLFIEAPHECDAGMQRDGVIPVPPAGKGERSWWFGQLIESTPLATWPARLGGRTARELVTLPVADDWAADLHAAWCRAAVRQRDEEWARALLGAPTAPPADTTGTDSPAERSKLLATLPLEERAAWAAGFIAAHGLSDAFQLLGVCTVPWAAPLGRAVVDALDIAREAGSYPWSFSGVMGLAERCLDPSEADRLDVLTTPEDEREDASPGAGGYWSEAFQRLVSTLRLRAAMETELAPAGP